MTDYYFYVQVKCFADYFGHGLNQMVLYIIYKLINVVHNNQKQLNIILFGTIPFVFKNFIIKNVS